MLHVGRRFGTHIVHTQGLNNDPNELMKALIALATNSPTLIERIMRFIDPAEQTEPSTKSKCV